MKVNVKKDTTLRLLERNELIETCGGTGTGNSVSMTMATSADTLLSLDFKWQQGNNYQEHKMEVGKDIDLNLNIFGSGASA